MAQKRMFSNLVIGSDDFLEMPDSSQNLYFYLSMQADDDGFVDNWKSIMRMIGKKEDDLKILITKAFIIPFDTGILVIRHWRLNNYIQKDRYKETIHKEEKSLLSIDKNNVYTLDTTCIPSIDKNRLDIDNNIYGQNENILTECEQEKMVNDEKNSEKQLKSEERKKQEEKKRREAEIEKDYTEKFEKFYKQYPRKVKKQDVLKWFKKNKPSNELFSSMLSSLEQFRASKEWQKDGGQFIPYPTTWLNQKRWEDEKFYVKEEKKQVNYVGIDTSQLTDEEYGLLMKNKITVEELIEKGRIHVQ